MRVLGSYYPLPDRINFVNRFRYKREAEKVLNIEMIGDTYYCLIKWKNLEELSYVKNKYVKKHCPSLLIKFYEDNLVVSDDN